MHYTLFDFLGTPLVPELCSDVTAGTSGNIHFVLIPIPTVRAFPEQFFVIVLDNPDFTVLAAYLTIIAFGV